MQDPTVRDTRLTTLRSSARSSERGRLAACPGLRRGSDRCGGVGLIMPLAYPRTAETRQLPGPLSAPRIVWRGRCPRTPRGNRAVARCGAWVRRLIEELEGDEGALSARNLYWNLRSDAAYCRRLQRRRGRGDCRAHPGSNRSHRISGRSMACGASTDCGRRSADRL